MIRNERLSDLPCPETLGSLHSLIIAWFSNQIFTFPLWALLSITIWKEESAICKSYYITPTLWLTISQEIQQISTPNKASSLYYETFQQLVTMISFIYQLKLMFYQVYHECIISSQEIWSVFYLFLEIQFMTLLLHYDVTLKPG